MHANAKSDPLRESHGALIVKWAWSSFIFPLGMRSKFRERPAPYFHAILDTARPTFWRQFWLYSWAKRWIIQKPRGGGDGLKKRSRWWARRRPTKANLSLPCYVNLRVGRSHLGSNRCGRNLNSSEALLPKEPSRDVNNLDIKMARRLFCERDEPAKEERLTLRRLTIDFLRAHISSLYVIGRGGVRAVCTQAECSRTAQNHCNPLCSTALLIRRVLAHSQREIKLLLPQHASQFAFFQRTLIKNSQFESSKLSVIGFYAPYYFCF